MNEIQKEKPATVKDKVSSQFSLIERKDYKAPSFSESLSSQGYVLWGQDNKFPEYLWSIYMRCTTLQSIINAYTDFTIGDKIINNTNIKGENSVGDTLQDVVTKCILDLWVYGGFAVQVFYNELGGILNLSYIDISRLRINETQDKVYMIEDFKAFSVGTRRTKTLEFDAFGTLSREERAHKGTEIYFYKGKKSKGFYPICDYIAALVSAETQIEIKRFHYNNISNGMLSATIINFNDADNVSDETKDQIEAAVKRKYGGASGAGEIMISWNSDKEHEVSTSKLDDDNFDSKFSQLAEGTREDLFISMRANPQLLGLAVNTGLNTQEFDTLYSVTNRTTIVPKQNEITRCFDKILSMGDYAANGPIDLHAFDIVPFSLGTQNTEHGSGLDS